MNTQLTAKNLSKTLFIYAFICFFTAIVFSCGQGQEITKRVPIKKNDTAQVSVKEEQIVGPIEVNEDNTVYSVDVKHPIAANSWSSITVELLDENKKFLMSFGEELWSETGYDSEGAWAESKEDFSIKVTIPKKGKYYLRLEGDASPSNLTRAATMTIQKKRGSSVAFWWAGFLSLIFAVVVWQFRKR